MYDFEKKFCDGCNAAKTEDGFNLDTNGGALCPRCYQEMLLQALCRLGNEPLTEGEIRIWVI